MRVVPIEGLSDPRVSDYRNVRDADLRADRGLFLAEGRLNVKRLLRGSGYRARSVFVTPAALAALRETLEALPDATPVFLAEQRVLNGVVGYAMHRGCLAAAERRPGPGFAEALASVPRGPRLWIVLEDVGNPDNVGGIFRNALAFGAERVLLSPHSADPLYRKSLRVSMGAALWVPHCFATHWPAELAALREAGFRLLALDPARDAVAIDAPELTRDARNVALLLGSEGAGLSAAALARADARVTIPMAEGIDSLNAATASGIALHRLATALGLL